MKVAEYRLLDGSKLQVEYDPGALCWGCGKPVLAASTSGTVICPWCDCGAHRDGTRWTYDDLMAFKKRFAENKERDDEIAKRRIVEAQLQPGLGL